MVARALLALRSPAPCCQTTRANAGTGPVLPQVASLMLPNYNGRVIDTIVQGDRASFKHDILFIVYLSLATGAFSSVRRFLFQLVVTLTSPCPGHH